jgi:hypothetical protein
MFEGLFDLERIDRGRRTVLHSTKNLAGFFPLKVAKRWLRISSPAMRRRKWSSVLLGPIACSSSLANTMFSSLSETRSTRLCPGLCRDRLLCAGSKARHCKGVQESRRDHLSRQIRQDLPRQTLASGYPAAGGARLHRAAIEELLIQLLPHVSSSFPPPERGRTTSEASQVGVYLLDYQRPHPICASRVSTYPFQGEVRFCSPIKRLSRGRID